MVIVRERYLGAAVSEIAWAFLPRIGCDRFVQIVAAPTVRKRLTVGGSRGQIVSAAQFLEHGP